MIYVFLANGFEEIEALAPVDILRRAKADVKTVGVTGKEVTSSRGVIVKTDITADEITLDDDLEMIVLPGGMPGTLNLEASDKVQSAVDFCWQNDRYIAAICAAPSILGHKGLLKGKTATSFPKFNGDLEGANVVDELVAVDGKFITAKGAGASIEFGLTLAQLIVSRETSDSIKASMQCR
ncbi:DJ-1 family glyoxalase III [Ruminococcus sp. FC2018]|uniref:DJ-1 family glyoxalase III n=1 Tax=Ruminococcus sp. FC2018 TaxID=1410617 RepID=UPI00048ADCE7|nr:DJ-1 family glyoxalase III [Ruminococcus sp. FC2018]